MIPLFAGEHLGVPGPHALNPFCKDLHSCIMQTLSANCKWGNLYEARWKVRGSVYYEQDPFNIV